MKGMKKQLILLGIMSNYRDYPTVRPGQPKFSTCYTVKPGSFKTL
jgi:hypothetical protein